MAEYLPSFPPFQPHVDSGDVATRWKKWSGKFKNLMVALDITDDARQKALLLHYVGDETNDIFDTLTVANADSTHTAIDNAISALTDHFAPKENMEFEIYKFRQAHQQQEEDFNSFLTRLRQLSSTCHFADVDRELKTQIIQGCTSSRLRRKALSDPTMTLAKMIDMARTSEVTERQAAGMEAKPTVNVVQHHKVTSEVSKKSSQYKGQCRNCGNSWPHDGGRQSCPAFGKACRKCLKENHFEAMCRGVLGPNSRQSDTVQRKPKSQYKSKSRLNQVQLSETSDSDDGYIYSISRSKIANQPKFEVKLNGSSITVIADSGASVNIIDEQDFGRLRHRSPLSLATSRVLPYGSNSSLPVIGTFNAVVEFGSNSTNAQFYVVKGSSGSLLSWDTSTKLRLIDVVREIRPVNTFSTPCDGTPSGHIDNLTKEYADLFQGLGRLKDFKVKLHIDETVPPCAQPHRRVPFHVRKQLEEQLRADEALGVIERVNDQTPWVSPLVVVPKKSPGQVRVCVDMRRANVAIKRERHVTPTINEVIHDLNGACVFSKLDLNQGYNQLELDESSRYITTFSSHFGLWRYRRLNFGINSAAEVFQNAIRETLNGIPGVINISDDILVYGRTQQQHDDNLRSCFARLREKHLTLNRSKCVFNKSSLEFFGYVFTKNGMEVDSKKVAAVVNLPNPTNQSEVRSLLGMTNFVSRFIPDYATLTEPLRELTHKNSVFAWSGKHEESFGHLRRALSNAPTLAYFDTMKDTALLVDASPVGLAAILVQQTPNSTKVQTVGYASRALTSVEQRYSQTEREALAVVWACEHFHIYVFGKPVKIYTDHKPLVSIYGNPNSKPPARIERWTLRLQPYDATVLYRAGADNPADYMSRHPMNFTKATSREEKIAEEYINFLTDTSVPKAMRLDEIRQATRVDPTLQAVFQAIQSNTWPQEQEVKLADVDMAVFNSYRKVKTELSINHSNGILLRQHRIIMPESLQKRAIELAHEGHQGITKTKALIREKIWFPGIEKLVENQLASCLPCQVATPISQREPLQMSALPKAAWTEVSVDFAQIGSEYLLVVTDDYSRYPVVDIVSSTSANAVIPKLDKIFSEFGIAEVVRSDNGPPFDSHDFRLFANELGFAHRKITPLWPRANGEVERFMRTIKKVVKTAMVTQRNWKQEMHRFLRNYRATPHCTTGTPPATALFGSNINIKIPQMTISDVPHRPVDFQSRDSERKEKMKAYADSKNYVRPSGLKLGDNVLLKSNPTLKSCPPFENFY